MQEQKKKVKMSPHCSWDGAEQLPTQMTTEQRTQTFQPKFY